MDNHYVENRLLSLTQIKEADLLQTKSYERQKKANIKEVNIPTQNDFRTQISVIVKMQKDADLLSAIPEYDFIPLSLEGRANRKIINRVWDYRWLKSNTDKAISDTIQSATTYGTGILYEGIKHLTKKVKTPFYKEDGTIDFKEEEKIFYSGIRCERIPFQNFFINGTDISNSTEAIVVSYYDKDEYIAEKELDSTYYNISKLKDSVRTYSLTAGTVGEPNSPQDANSKTITELKYYNSAKDEFIIVANGIEVRSSPIPYTHKQLPFVLYIDNKSDDRIFGIGEFELLEQEERTKNELRTLLIRGIKYSIGIVLKNRNADLEADELQAGMGEVYETDDIDGIKQISFNVPVGAISDAEFKLDNDIVAKSGVDFKSLELSASETATRTASKSQSSKKRINKNVKDNAFNFYRRLGELRMSNLQFIHSLGAKEIPIEGGSINADGVFESEEGGGYGSATITKDLVAGDFLVMPIVDTMIGNNKQRRREDIIQYSQLVGNLTSDDGVRVVKGAQLAKLLTEEFDYDYEKLTEQNEVSKTAEQSLKDLDLDINGAKGTAEDPNYVPPEQRNLQQQVPTLSGVQKNTLPLE